MFCMFGRLLIIIASKFAPLSIFPHLCLDCEHLLASSERNISVVIPPVSVRVAKSIVYHPEKEVVEVRKILHKSIKIGEKKCRFSLV